MRAISTARRQLVVSYKRERDTNWAWSVGAFGIDGVLWASWWVVSVCSHCRRSHPHTLQHNNSSKSATVTRYGIFFPWQHHPSQLTPFTILSTTIQLNNTQHLRRVLLVSWQTGGVVIPCKLYARQQIPNSKHWGCLFLAGTVWRNR